MATPAGILNGNEIKVYAGSGVLVAYATSGTININHNTRDITNKESSGWKEVLEGSRDWTIDVEGMYAWVDASGSAITDGIDDIINSYIITQAAVTVTWGSTDGETGDTKYSGSAYMTSASMTGATDDSATYSASFQGTAAITQTVS
jgi:TP901-1 family phage major tail protein